MAHIHNNPGEHDLTASAYIIDVTTDVPRVILHMHKRLGILLQFGGHVELNENPWQSISHEMREEAGYDINKLGILQPRDRIIDLGDESVLHPSPICINTHNFSELHRHTDIGFAFVAYSAPSLEPDVGESRGVFRFSSEELAALPEDAKIPGSVRRICLYALKCYENNEGWEVVPAKDFEN